MQIRHVAQISEDHCGPAVLEMLLDAIDIHRTQEEITTAAGMTDDIEDYGITVRDLGKACLALAPQAQFWYKNHSNLDDVAFLLESGFAVGVEWQGMFHETEEEEAASDMTTEDFGHYSIISHYDQYLQELIIVDPYQDFAHQDRIFPVEFFVKRWWDLNDVRDTRTGLWSTFKSEHLLFFVTPKSTYLPREYGFRAFYSDTYLY